MSETKKITSLKVMGFDDKYVFRDDHARVYHDLTEIDATITSLGDLCEEMPTNSILIIDELSLGTVDIGLKNTQGKAPAGIYVFIKGSSKSRFSMMFLSASYSANEPGFRFGNYAADENDRKINWSEDLYGHLINTNNPHEVHAAQIIKSITVTTQVNDNSNANTKELRYNSTRILSISAKATTSTGTTTALLCSPFKPNDEDAKCWWCHISDTLGQKLNKDTQIELEIYYTEIPSAS